MSVMLLLAILALALFAALGFGLASLRLGTEQRPGFNGRPARDRWTL